jgi:hypothetical protein
VPLSAKRSERVALDGYLDRLAVAKPDLPADNTSEIAALVCELSALGQDWAGLADLERGHRGGIASAVVEHPRIGLDAGGTGKRRCLPDDLDDEIYPVQRRLALDEFRLAGSADLAASRVVAATATPVSIGLLRATPLGTHAGQRSGERGSGCAAPRGWPGATRSVDLAAAGVSGPAGNLGPLRASQCRRVGMWLAQAIPAS